MLGVLAVAKVLVLKNIDLGLSDFMFTSKGTHAKPS